ncbi:MAG: hypothetical protein IJ008_03905 [Clostridia bacterium]|nr:hypothetical protein [Clostridia bacterium]
MKQTLKYIYEKLFEQQKFAENKHSILITLATAIAVFSVAYLENVNTLITLLSACSILFSLLSLSFSFIALFAKKSTLKKSKKIIEYSNLMFYKDIVKFDENEYLKALKNNYPFPKNYTFDNMDKDLSRQVIATAKSVEIKFQFFNFALTFLFASIICEVFVILLMSYKI